MTLRFESRDPVDQILAQWQRERPDLDVSPMGVIGRMGRIRQHLEREIEAVFTEFGLKSGGFDVLATLRRSGDPYRLSPTQLYNTLMISSGAMTHRLDGLEQAKWVERIPDPYDRRGTLIQLTSQGFELVEKVLDIHVANEHRLLAGLAASEQQMLAALLSKLLMSFDT